MLVYRKATAARKTYSQSSLSFYYFCAYDNKSDIFVDGENSNDQFVLAELSKKGAWQNISLNATLGIPGNLQWRKRTLIVGNQGTQDGDQALYEFSIKNTTATEVGSTPLTGAGDVPQGWFQGKTSRVPRAATQCNRTALGRTATPSVRRSASLPVHPRPVDLDDRLADVHAFPVVVDGGATVRKRIVIVNDAIAAGR